jgi:hypothetical protein
MQTEIKQEREDGGPDHQEELTHADRPRGLDRRVGRKRSEREMETNGSDFVVPLLIHCREDKGPGIAVLPVTSLVCTEHPLIVLGMHSIFATFV